MIEPIPFILLILCHVLGDFYLQSEKLVAAKNQPVTQALLPQSLHAFIHGFLVLTVLGLAYSWEMQVLYIAVVISVTHLVIDVTKSVFQNSRPLLAFTLDQLIHFFVLLCIALYIGTAPELQLSFAWEGSHQYAFLVMGLGILLVLKPASVVVRVVLNGLHSGPPIEGFTLPQGGQILGYLERMIILILILMDQFAAIGFVIAAKSVLRFSDINRLREASDGKSPNPLYLTEYVLVGTFMSFLYVLVIGLLVRLIW